MAGERKRSLMEAPRSGLAPSEEWFMGDLTGKLLDLAVVVVMGVLVGVLLLELANRVEARENPPATLEEILETKPVSEKVVKFADERRQAAMRDAALGFGTQSGLVRRAFELGQVLDRYERQLDRVYRFDRVLIEREGFQVLPPVVVETTHAFRRGDDGRRAATARRVLRIERPAQVVGRAPRWRGYFERTWETPRPPSAVLFPRAKAERELWRRWVEEGWAEGTRLAEDIFAADLDRLNRDFEGVVRWRVLEAQRMVTAPELDVMRWAVVGGGREMRVDERAIAIEVDARLNPITEDWVVIEEAPWPR